MAEAKVRRFVRMFKPCFGPAVAAGLKTQTVRPLPKRLPRPGDIIDCRQWSGLPYRSPHLHLAMGRVVRVRAIWISEFGVTIWGNPKLLQVPVEQWWNPPFGVGSATAVGRCADGFARADGFENFKEMSQWFAREHGLPFAGCLTVWEPMEKGGPA